MRVENGVVVGSHGKYELRNPIARFLLNRFDRAVLESLREASPSTVLEIGCGEGHVTELILSVGATRVLATDISVSLIKENVARATDPRVSFEVADLMSLSGGRQFDTIVCCEVLEHLDDPEQGIQVLHRANAREYVFSVPREPLWRVMNMCRGAYLSRLGNSPGHVNHFSQRGFLRFIERQFEVLAVRAPLPWTVVRCRPR
jgi:SAM-dependent methyltransferase